MNIHLVSFRFYHFLMNNLYITWYTFKRRSYHDFLIIPTISGKADNYRLLLKKGRDNFFKKGRYLIAQIQMP